MTADKLKPGDVIGIVAPSHVGDPVRYAPMIRSIEARGFRVKIGKNLYSSTYGYSASGKERADDFNAMALDNEVKMVLFGGGEGGNELLPYLDFEGIRKNPKLYCSYSDGTTILNAIYAKTGLGVFYGQAPGIFQDLRYYDFMQFSAHFMEESADRFEPKSDWQVVREGSGEGVLIGGYARNFALLTGSRYFPYPKQDYLLFLEDHEKFSDLAALSSYISHIEQSDFIEHVRGLVFGHYSVETSSLLLDRLRRFGEKHGVPVVYTDDFGHGVSHGILPIGRRARLDTNEKTLLFL